MADSSLEELARTVVPSELMSAIDETPGLSVPVLAMFAVFELFGFRNLIPNSVAAAYTIEILIACLVGLILYSHGNFWDSMWFDRRYSVKAVPGREKEWSEGIWLKEKKPIARMFPPGIFPPGEPLHDARKKAAQALNGNPKDFTDIYGRSEMFLRRAGQWKEVLPPVVLSKFARSFIWPALLLALTTAGFLVRALFRENGWHVDQPSGTYTLGTVAALILTALAFHPYVALRVKHVKSLFSLASEASSQLGGAPTEKIKKSMTF